MVEFKLTNRLGRMIQLAQQAVVQQGISAIYPVHLLIGALQEGTGVLGELRVYNACLMGELKAIAKKIDDHETYFQSELFEKPISKGVVDVIKQSISVMKNNGQNYLNEGHVIKAIVELDNEVSRGLTKVQIQHILLIATACRDLVTVIKNYSFSPRPMKTDISIQQSKSEDFERIYAFIAKEFGENWARGIKRVYNYEDIPVYYATHQDEIVGFAVYDQVAKGIFGPMGVRVDYRGQDIGFNLLQYSLRSMQNKGYERIIINDAGPIEFYEKSCQAEPVYE